jgi:uncharacterized membrane protein YdjX (TVP38/TMEM64 family)
LRSSSSSDPTGSGRAAPPPYRALWRLFGLFLALALLIALPFFVWGEHFETALARDRMIAALDDYRGFAWLVAIGLLVSDLLLPIPNTMVIAALGVLYGPLLGGLIATAGNLLSGLLGYGLCRRFGRPLARRLLGEADLVAGERLFATSGGWMVAASRWLPIVPEVVACMAGLARMRLSAFLLALLSGAAPLSFVLAGLGYAGSDRPLLTLFLCALLPLPIWYGLRRSLDDAPEWRKPAPQNSGVSERHALQHQQSRQKQHEAHADDIGPSGEKDGGRRRGVRPETPQR